MTHPDALRGVAVSSLTTGAMSMKAKVIQTGRGFRGALFLHGAVRCVTLKVFTDPNRAALAALDLLTAAL